MKIYRLLLILFFTFNILFAQKEIVHKYTVRITEDLSELSIQVKFGDIDFYHLYAGSESASKYLYNMRLVKNGVVSTYSSKSHEIALKRNAANATLSYKVNINAALQKGRRSDARKIGKSIIFPPTFWLWRPYKLEKWEHLEIELDVPDQVSYSVPWKPVKKNTYRVYPTPYNWSSCAVFGGFNTDTVEVIGGKISVSYLDGTYITSKEDLKKWVKEAANAVCMVYGSFPLDNLQVVLIPGAPRNEPVPFGMVVRGGGVSVQFFIDPSKPIEDFIADWTATHELSHCLLPFVKRNDAWLSEGLATYYQYVLMGRDGRLSERDAWQRIYNGFQKGIRDSRGETLEETSENMHKYRSFKSVYWSGAALLLKADVALRAESNGRYSLDEALKSLANRFYYNVHSWDAKELFDIMDVYCSSDVFNKNYNEHIYSKDFPVDDTYWESLGVIINEGKVNLTNNAPFASIRKQIIPSRDN